MFRSFFATIFRGSSAVLCALNIPLADFVLLRSMWPHVCVICVCLVFLSVGDLLVTAGGIVTAQSTVEDPLKIVVKKDRNM